MKKKIIMFSVLAALLTANSSYALVSAHDASNKDKLEPKNEEFVKEETTKVSGETKVQSIKFEYGLFNKLGEVEKFVPNNEELIIDPSLPFYGISTSLELDAQLINPLKILYRDETGNWLEQNQLTGAKITGIKYEISPEFEKDYDFNFLVKTSGKWESLINKELVLDTPLEAIKINVQPKVKVDSNKNQTPIIDEQKPVIDNEKKKENINNKEKESDEIKPSLTYDSHVECVGWQPAVNEGEMAGTMGKGLRLEALKLHLGDTKNGDIEGQAHVQNKGWLNYQKSGNIVGSMGEGLRLEGLKLRLTGKLKEEYNVYYRVYAEGFGWYGWAKNGELAGSVGCNRGIEAVEIKLLPKDEKFNTEGASYGTNKYVPGAERLVYTSHVQNMGWLNPTVSHNMTGTTGRGLRMEAFQLQELPATITSKGNITYQAHVQNVGWQNPVSAGEVAGTTGQGLRMEAIRFNLTPYLAKYYDIYYRAHISGYGWLGWAHNGRIAGSVGCARQVEAIQVMLYPKRGNCPITPELRSYIKKNFYYKDYGHGFAGKRPSGWKPKGVVIHNTAGAGDTALGYLQSFIPGRVHANQMDLGYTHYYIDRFNVVQVAKTEDAAWHTANADGNTNYIGYEVCDSKGNANNFMANEQAVFRQAAEDLKVWGLSPNRSTVRIHREFTQTACPHRTWELHGRNTNVVKDYIISQIRRYM